jgi:cytochrome c551/c552
VFRPNGQNQNGKVMNKCLGLLVVFGLLSAGPAHAADGADAQAIMENYRCTICHADYDTLAGPPYAEIAARLKGNPNARAIIVGVVRKGVHGGGPWPMPPSPQVSVAEAEVIARYILALKPQS